MLPRDAEVRLRGLLRTFPAVGLLGPRQVGKTTLARAVADELGDRAVYLDLELPSDRAKLSDAEVYFSRHDGRLIVMDEIHRAPEIFQTLRGVIDKRRRKGIPYGQFLILGSASVELLQQSSETLAGRIAWLELTPFTVAEVDVSSIDGPTAYSRTRALDALWVRGGFPDSYLAENDSDSFEWRLAFLRTYLERDVPMLGPRIPAETLRRLWEMLAHNHSQMLNAARVASGLGVSAQTVARYLDVLVDLLLVRRLQPWMANGGKRLVRAPKVFVRDSGILHALLGIENKDRLLGHPTVGASWEGFVIDNLLASASEGTRASFYRTAAGAEIDLVLEIRSGSPWAIEVKRSVGSPNPSKGFHIGSDDLGARRRFVVYPGTERFQFDAKTEVLPLTEMIAELRAASPFVGARATAREKTDRRK